VQDKYVDEPIAARARNVIFGEAVAEKVLVQLRGLRYGLSMAGLPIAGILDVFVRN
jgi:hypothetical protein